MWLSLGNGDRVVSFPDQQLPRQLTAIVVVFAGDVK